MWELVMLVGVMSGNATYGGPIVVEGFKTEAACIAHAEKIKSKLPKSLPRGSMFVDARVAVEHVSCTKVDFGD